MQAPQKPTTAPGLGSREVARSGPGEVILAVEAAGSCGTDVHIVEWTPGYEAWRRPCPSPSATNSRAPSVATGPGVAAPGV